MEVDRGASTYVQPIVDSCGTRRDVAAWGLISEGRAYCEVSAVPSATLVLRDKDSELGKIGWNELQHGEPLEVGPTRIQLAESGRNWVHVQVLDKGTGRPVHCRVHFSNREGVPFQPHGHHNEVNSNLGTWHIDVGGDVRLGDLTYAYTDGSCQGWLPRGEVVVEVARGFEYAPLRKVVTIVPGQRDLTVEIERWIDMGELGWFSGDTHVHFLSTQGSHLEQQCEDLRVVNLLQSQWGSLFTNTEDFAGAVSATDDGKYLTYVGQENRQHIFGHLTLLGLKEPVMPWCSGGPPEGEIGGSLESTLADWADSAHSQGGTVIIPHFPFPNGEPAVLVTTGRADAVESIRWNRDAEEIYYSYLNCGYKLPLVGGTDKMSSEVPVGLYRTYAKVEGEFSYESWCSAVRAGRTFLSGGPILQLMVDGHDVGDTVQLSGSGTVQVAAWAESIFPLALLEIVVNGKVVASAGSTSAHQGRLAIDEVIQITGHSWVAARCYGEQGSHLDIWRRPIYAHTSPVYIAIGGEWVRRDETCPRYLLTLVEGGLQYLRRAASFYEGETVTHNHGGADHLGYLEAPFHEARQAVRRRYPGVVN